MSHPRILTDKQFDKELTRLREQISASTKPLPEEEKAARVKRAATDLMFFAQTYFPHYMTCAPSALHKYFAERYPKMILSGAGSREATAAPRGNAKSTWTTLILPLWCAAYRYRYFPLIVSETNTQAVDFISFIKLELEINERLAQDFPDLTGEGSVWRADTIITKNGVKIRGVGAGQKLRGNREGTEALETLSGAALKMGADSVFAAGEIIKAQAVLAQSGYTAAENINILGVSEKYAQAAGMELAASAQTVSDLLGGYGLAAGDAARLTDVISATTRMADVSFAELTDTLMKNAVMFRSLGVPVEDAAGIMAVFADAGIKGAEAGALLEPVIYKLTSVSGDAAEAFRSLSIATEDANGKLRNPIETLTELSGSLAAMSDAGKVDMLKKIFGDKADKLIYPLIDMINREGIGAISKFTAELQGAGGMTAKLAAIQDATLVFNCQSYEHNF
jgi:TP901 family phage tail tape measure protein